MKDILATATQGASPNDFLSNGLVVEQIPHVLVLFNAMPQMLFWVKDVDGYFLAINDALAKVMNRTVDDVVGQLDSDLVPYSLAEVYRRDDLEVMRTGQTLDNKLEAVWDGGGQTIWRATTKMPLYNTEGNVVGTVGMSRQVQSMEGYPGSVNKPEFPSDFAAVLSRVESHQYDEPLHVEQLADLSCVSVRTLERWFKEYVGMSPKKYLDRARVTRSCQLLAGTDKPIKTIASMLGFSATSVFTRHFKSIIGYTPQEYRMQYRR